MCPRLSLKDCKKRKGVNKMAELGIEKFLRAEHGKKIHLHNFKIQFIFSGSLSGDYVSGIDFHDVMPKIDSILQQLENKYLPDVDGIGHGTCENLCCYLIRNLNHPNLKSVRIWEDVDRFVEVFANEVPNADTTTR